MNLKNHKELYRETAKRLNVSEEYVEFIVEDVFKGIKKVIKEQLFNKFWKGVAFTPFIIVVSPKELLRKNYFEKYLWYMKHRSEYDIKTGNYKTFEIDNYPRLKEKLDDFHKRKELASFLISMNQSVKQHKD